VIITRTPFRISFFGGGTDYPSWYRAYGGSVLGTTINKYCYISCRYLPPFFEHRFRIVYSKTETCGTVDEIAHPAVREILRHLKIDRGVEIHHDGDLPARSGLGSSSAFTVGLLNALYGLRGHMASKHQLATESVYIEQEVLKEVVGSQDQTLAAYGGFNHISFLPSGEISVRPMTLTQERIQELNDHLVLLYTGIKRTASDIAQTCIENLRSKERQMRLLGLLVNEAVTILTGKSDIGEFGKLLHEGWLAKQSLSPKVSNARVEGLYAEAMSAGAMGGKLIGAGGGGFMLLFVKPEDRPRILQKLNTLIHVPFKFENSGSQTIFFDPEEDFSMAEQARTHQPIPMFEELAELETRGSVSPKARTE
jgi:D-glycero-alpha-D-manno-heptose-7-phosphate kinase